MFNIKPLAMLSQTDIEHTINNKTKPVGSLGKLEELAMQLALILGANNPQLTKPTQLVFAGDHGVSELGVSIAGAEVTGLMVANFCHGGAAINVFCTQNDMTLQVIDCGTVAEQPNHDMLIKQRLGSMTKPFNTQSALTLEQTNQGLEQGAKIAQEIMNNGSNIIGIGEMGIGNTTSAAAIMHVLTGHEIDLCVGQGTGVDEITVQRKKEIIKQATLLHKDNFSENSLNQDKQPEDNQPNAKTVLTLLGGFEIAQMVGAMLAIAQAQKVIIVDGFISSAAALIACKMAPYARDYMIFSHCSKELGHQLMLKELNASAVLDLNLRLGEGSGCPLVLPLLKSALAFYNNMASFEQANITVEQP